MIITGTHLNINAPYNKYKLKLTKTILAQDKGGDNFYLNLKELKRKSVVEEMSVWGRLGYGDARGYFAQLYKNTDCYGPCGGEWYVNVEMIKTKDGGGVIGCTRFDKETFKKIKAAIRAA